MKINNIIYWFFVIISLGWIGLFAYFSSFKIKIISSVGILIIGYLMGKLYYLSKKIGEDHNGNSKK